MRSRRRPTSSALPAARGGKTHRSRRWPAVEQPGDAEDREGKPFVGPAGVCSNRCSPRPESDELFKWPPPDGPYTSNTVPVNAALTTFHASSVLRARSSEERKVAFAGLVEDLRTAAGTLR